MNLVKRAGWQLAVSTFTLVLHVIMVLVCLLVFILSPLAQVALWMRLRGRPQLPRKDQP